MNSERITKRILMLVRQHVIRFFDDCTKSPTTPIERLLERTSV